MSWINDSADAISKVAILESKLEEKSREIQDLKYKEDENDQLRAMLIRNRLCPFGKLKEGQVMAHCPSGFPGCACGDEIVNNKYLADILDPPKSTGV